MLTHHPPAIGNDTLYTINALNGDEDEFNDDSGLPDAAIGVG